MVDKFHVNPYTGMAGKCASVAGKCPFAAYDAHWYSAESATAASEAKLQYFYDWVSKSRHPQEPGWFTEHVFDPARPSSVSNERYGALTDAGVGTKLYMENGWILRKKAFGWDFLEGEDNSVMPLIKGRGNTTSKFGLELAEFGGRLDITEGIYPLKIDWSLKD